MASERVLLVLGNSVSLPSAGAAPNEPVISYPELLQDRLRSKGWRIERRIVSGATVSDIEQTAQSALPQLRPDAIVIQLGIVDCTPRPLRERERELLSRVRPSVLQNLIIALIHRYRGELIGHRPLIQRTPFEPFRKHFRRLVDQSLAVAKHLAILPIFPATESILARNPRLAAEIAKYNATMRMEPGATMPEATEVFDGVSIEALCITPESVHLNQRAHGLIAAYLERWLFLTTGEAQAD